MSERPRLIKYTPTIKIPSRLNSLSYYRGRSQRSAKILFFKYFHHAMQLLMMIVLNFPFTLVA